MQIEMFFVLFANLTAVLSIIFARIPGWGEEVNQIELMALPHDITPLYISHNSKPPWGNVSQGVNSLNSSDGFVGRCPTGKEVLGDKTGGREKSRPCFTSMIQRMTLHDMPDIHVV